MPDTALKQVAASRDIVEADIVYTPIDGRRHKVFIPPMGGGVSKRTHPDQPVRVAIRNGRHAAGGFDLDRDGFALREAPSAVRNFYDEAEVEDVYYRELEALLKRETGARRVLIFDHTIRIDDGARSRELGKREPVRRAHVDYTEKSGPERVRQLAGAEADDLLSGRFAEVNVWRPITGPVNRAPLAVAEAGSLAPDDLIPTDLVYDDRVGEIYETAHNPAHRWVWFPDMSVDEVLFLKSYDSATDGRSRFTPHTAFDDPATPAGAPARESIEVRAFLFFGD
ncbi:CmcJ/NvfI family oxidoreductase [Minwuia thermotolerans]|uniref:CmcJ/NvfI family oxidoreductase n=1 Tax=Minwuia thermotolerans TaxID=2056226 RepID=UPI000F639676|nr:CmcJ/NvfI family oxidoreductase [Minwuia thermotolerans]